MIEDEPGLLISNKIMKTSEIGNDHGATVRHRLEWCEPERLAALGNGGVNKKARCAKHFGQLFRIEHRSDETNLRRGAGRSLSERIQISLASTAKFSLHRTDNH